MSRSHVIFVFFFGFNMLSIAEGCFYNSDCSSNWCERGKWSYSGKCTARRKDGAAAYNKDYNSCESGTGFCGTCGSKLSNGKTCYKNSNCASGWCEGGYAYQCIGTCKYKRKKSIGEPCDSDGECTSGECRGINCGASGTISSFVGLGGTCDYNLCYGAPGFPVGKPCTENRDCDQAKAWCKGGGAYKVGKCMTRLENGAVAYNEDFDSCMSRSGICGICGSTSRLPNGRACKQNSNCASGWCDGGKYKRCLGKCKSKKSIGEGCGFDAECTTGDCMGIGCKFGSCEHKLCYGSPGFPVGKPCTEDRDCDQAKAWCKGGGVYKVGKCTACPGRCGNQGCKQCNNEGEIVCGKTDGMFELNCVLNVSFLLNET